MVKVITYGTYDLLHYGHRKLLERARALGDYLIVGVTSDDYDKTRGKINNRQSLIERISAVKATGLADEVIVEEYEGQKIDDIKRYNVDIFTVGSDWEGKFDYLREYCKVVYLPRTEGISSTELRSESPLKLKVIGSIAIGEKFKRESAFVNSVSVTEESDVDAYYVISTPEEHYHQIRDCLSRGKHVLCESPIALSGRECDQLLALAEEKGLVLMDAIKTAYSTAFSRLVLLAKSGKIGDILCVDATCTSMRYVGNELENQWNSICAWGPTALLPVFQILGTDYEKKTIATRLAPGPGRFDGFTKIDFLYKNAAASIKVAKEAKSEGELVVTGTKGYIYVPAPWWKTDYFEVRYEDPADNKRYFYQLDGEGLRYEMIAFAKAVGGAEADYYISRSVSKAICEVMEDFCRGIDTVYL